MNAALTSREMDVLRLLREGLTQRAIQARLGISHHTVNRHIHNIHDKLALSTTIECVWAMRRELELADA